MTRKEPSVAMLLSVFLPGAGSIYAGRVGYGLWRMLMTPIWYAFFFPAGIAIHILAVLKAAEHVADHNLRVELLEDDTVLPPLDDFDLASDEA